MGVAFYVGGKSTGAQWSYSGFNSFRHRLAASIGIDLDRMRGFGKVYEPLAGMPSLCDVLDGKAKMPTKEEIEEQAKGTAKKYKESGGSIPWDTVTDPVKPLLNHSDCEGQLSPEECAQVAPRLRELLASWDDKVTFKRDPDFKGAIPVSFPEELVIDDHDKRCGLLLAQGMEEAARRGIPLEFS